MTSSTSGKSLSAGCARWPKTRNPPPRALATLDRGQHQEPEGDDGDERVDHDHADRERLLLEMHREEQEAAERGDAEEREGNGRVRGRSAADDRKEQGDEP